MQAIILHVCLCVFQWVVVCVLYVASKVMHQCTDQYAAARGSTGSHGMCCSQYGSIPTYHKEQTLTHTCTYTRSSTRIHTGQISASKHLFRGSKNGRLAGARGSPVPGGFL